MEIFWLVFVLALVVVVGNALLLLRTAKKPTLPKSFSPKPWTDGEDDA
jgi:hypothetical protein